MLHSPQSCCVATSVAAPGVSVQAIGPVLRVNSGPRLCRNASFVRHFTSARAKAALATLKPMRVLGIETSCDETGVALVEWQAGRAPRLLSEALHSQAELHQPFGGVVPELASRDHIRRVLPLAQQVLWTAGSELASVDGIAYTRGPGLAGALLVGAGVACALACALDKPAWGIHHLEGHLVSPFLARNAPSFPFVALLV